MYVLRRGKWIVELNNLEEAVALINLVEEIDGHAGKLSPMDTPRVVPRGAGPKLAPVRTKRAAGGECREDWTPTDARDFLNASTFAGQRLVRALVIGDGEPTLVAELAKRMVSRADSVGSISGKLRRDAERYFADKHRPLVHRGRPNERRLGLDESFCEAARVVLREGS